MTGFKPASDVVYKGCIHLCADRRKITFRFGENRHFHVGVDNNGEYRGGTAATIRYARKLDREIIIIDPATGKISQDA